MVKQVGELLWGENPTNYYGLAFWVITLIGQDKTGVYSAGTFFGDGGFNTQYFADPKEKIIGILMKQTFGKVPDFTRGDFIILMRQAIDD